MSQNYPNPFNPITTIRYSIPIAVNSEKLALSPAEVSIVSLVVYDVLGREVATLLNENQKPGNYEFEWDATDHSSGIYFYRLQVYPANGGEGDYAETKKMILLK